MLKDLFKSKKQLLYKASKEGNVEKVKSLLSKETNVNWENPDKVWNNDNHDVNDPDNMMLMMIIRMIWQRWWCNTDYDDDDDDNDNDDESFMGILP